MWMLQLKIAVIITSLLINEILSKFLPPHPTNHSSAKNAEKLPPCNEDTLMMHLAQLQAINPESIVHLSTLQDLESLCLKVSDNLSKVDNYLKTCDPPTQQDLYIQLIKGVNSLHEKLCTESAFHKKFQLHYTCFNELHTDFEDCNGPADWEEHADRAKVCSAYKEIEECYYIKTAKVCGKLAAELMKELMEAVMCSILTVQCDNLKSPVVSDAMPDENKSKWVQPSVMLSAVEVIVFVALFRHSIFSI